MRAVVHSLGSRSWSRAVLIGTVAAGLTACSSESTRFSDPNSNPFASWTKAPAEVTGSVAAPASANRISAQPLPPPNASRPATIASTGVSGGGHGMASFTPVPAADPRALATKPVAHGITGSVARPTMPSAPKSATASSLAGNNVHVVAPGETLMSISRRYHKPVAEIAAANRIPPHTLVKIGDRLVIPGNVALHQPSPVVAAPKVQAPARVQTQAANHKVAAVEPQPTARVVTPGATAVAADDASPTMSAGNPSFRWPVRGRVITGFGPKPNGQQNDGINLAVPEGTAIRAAEDGVVAYAGNELKGYGNLILIRHANGFVTAYAHASEIMVKRNDQVRRGQIIAKSGQTGTVTTPQLHFEIRKGSAPVDPAQYLPAGA